MDIGDIENPDGRRHQIGSLTWNQNVIQYVEVNRGWRRQGIGREMLRLAREIAPTLRHAPCGSRRDDGEAFVRATDPDQACPDDIDVVPRPISGSSGPWRRLMHRIMGRSLR